MKQNGRGLKTCAREKLMKRRNRIEEERDGTADEIERIKGELVKL